MTTVRNKTLRDRYRRTLAQNKPPCHLCGAEINYQAHHLDPNSFTIDHIIPLSRGGKDTLENCAPCCRSCNRAKGDSMPRTVTFVTERDWSSSWTKTTLTHQPLRGSPPDTS
jgi:5-methylcytosine-specific restriction endonuclease McrA